jgi:hypothetical protein
MAVKLYRGDTWKRAWELRDAANNPIDLTGASARLQVRDQAGNVVVSASTTDGRITITPAAGRIFGHRPCARIAPLRSRSDARERAAAHLRAYAAGSGSTLASPAPATFTAGTGVTPAIYLVGS